MTRKNLVRMLLQLAVVGGVVGLTGCGPSVADQSAQQATAKNIEAVRLANSAGDPRPTQAFADRVNAEGGSEKADKNALANTISTEQAAGKGTLMVQKDILDDLKAARDLLNQANGLPELPKDVQAQVMETAGQVDFRAAATRLTRLQELFDEMIKASAAVTRNADMATSQARQAKTLEAGLTAGSVQIAAKITEIQAQITAGTKASNDAAEAAKNLQTQVEAKRGEITQLQAAAGAERMQADTVKGMEGIAAQEKAGASMKLVLAAQAQLGILIPQMDAALYDAETAQVNLAKITRDLETLGKELKARKQLEDITAAQIEKIKQQNLTLLTTGTDPAVKKYDDFRLINRKFQAAREAALTAAEASRDAFQKASDARKAYRTTMSSAEQFKDPIARQDPRFVNSQKQDGEALLLVQLATANFMVGQVNMLVDLADRLESATQGSLTRAGTETGVDVSLNATTPPASSPAAPKEKALEAWRKAIANLETAQGINMPEYAAPRWMGLSLTAVINRAIFVANGDLTAKTQSAEAAAKAIELNPNLGPELNYLK